MKRFSLVLAVLLMIAPVWASEANSYSGDIAAAGTTCATTKACISADLDRSDSFAVVQVSGTFTATLQFEASADKTNYVSISGTPSGGGSAVKSATASGAWQFNVSGYKVIRVRASAYTSGTATVKITISSAPVYSVAGASLPDTGADGACLVTSSGAWVRGACSGSSSTGAWGSISGTLTSQADLKNALDLKLNAADLNATLITGKFSGTGDYLKSDGTKGTPSSGTGTVTNTGGALTLNSLMLGAGTNDAKVMASDPTNCSAGQAPTGIDKTGAAKGCFTPSGALPAGVSSDGANGLAVTGKVAAASIETSGSGGSVLIPDGGTAAANTLTSAATGVLKWGATAVSLATHTHGPANVTTTVGTTAIAANSCTASATTVTMTGLTTAMTFDFTPTSDTSAVTGWGSTGGLVIVAWPTADTLNYKVCNQTGSSITPGGSVTFNVSAR